MKKLLIVLIALQLLFSCNYSDNNEYNTSKTSTIDYTDKKVQDKKERLSIYADSLVNLSFKGITLGKSFIKTINNAENKKDIYNVVIESDNEGGKSATCAALLVLPDVSEEEEVRLKIASFQDTITSFIIISDKYETRNSIMNLYKSKYNEEYSEIETDYDNWGDKKRRSWSESNIWTFKNQSLRLSCFKTEQRENYVKDARMRSPKNRYGIRYTNYFNKVVIIYSDLKQLEKVNEYDALREVELAIKREKERAIQVRKDSIERVENEKRISQQDF